MNLRPGYRRLGVTMIELVIVTLLVGITVPALTGALSRQMKRHKSEMNKSLAAMYAEEGTELLINGGFAHWWGIVRRSSLPPGGGPYEWEPTPLPPGVYPDSTDVTLTVTAAGALTDDPFNPFIGTAGQPDPIQFSPWFDYRRSYTLVSLGRTASETISPRILKCTVEVLYGATGTESIIVPVILANHRPSSTTTPVTTRTWRSLLWPGDKTQLGVIDDRISTLIPSPSEALWGRAAETTTPRDLYNSTYPVGALGVYPE